MENQKLNKALALIFVFSIVQLLSTCEDANTTELDIEPEANTIFIDIDVEKLLLEANPGDEVPQFVQMYNGAANHNTGTAGEANLVTELSAGDNIIWQLGSAEGVTITGFEFFVISGDNAFELSGGQQPQAQADGSWKARASPNLERDAEIKYNVLFEVNGKEYWWDPIVKITSGGQG